MPGDVEEADLAASMAKRIGNGLRLLGRTIQQRSDVNQGNGAHGFVLARLSTMY